MVPAPRRLRAFPNAERVKPKSGVIGGTTRRRVIPMNGIINMGGSKGTTEGGVTLASSTPKPAA
jgi:hypothetical protein